MAVPQLGLCRANGTTCKKTLIMHSVLFRLQRQAESDKMSIADIDRRIRLMKEQDRIRRRPAIEREVYKRLGLWNMDDFEYYGNQKVFERLLQVENMLLTYKLFNLKYLHPFNEEWNEYRGLTEVPIIALKEDLLVYEFKPPFTKAFFERLINNECDLLEFGNDYVVLFGGKCFATIELFSLFVKQSTKNAKLLKQNLCSQLK